MRSLTGAATERTGLDEPRTLDAAHDDDDLPKLLTASAGRPAMLDERADGADAMGFDAGFAAVGGRLRGAVVVRKRFRQIGAGLLGLVFAGLLGLQAGGYRVPVAEALIARLDAAAVSVGLDISQVAVTGYRHAPLDEIYDAVGLQGQSSFLAFDTRAARARIEDLTWIERAQMVHILPDTLAIHVVERRPFAVWQHRGMLFVVDREGHELAPIGPDEYTGLPQVVGEGAAKAAPRLLKALEDHPDLRRRLGAGVRVADRRWTLQLTGGPEIALPAGDIAPALARLARLQERHAILERPVAAVDLRLPGKVVLKPSQARVSGLTTSM